MPTAPPPTGTDGPAPPLPPDLRGRLNGELEGRPVLGWAPIDLDVDPAGGNRYADRYAVLTDGKLLVFDVASGGHAPVIDVPLSTVDGAKIVEGSGVDRLTLTAGGRLVADLRYTRRCRRDRGPPAPQDRAAAPHRVTGQGRPARLAGVGRAGGRGQGRLPQMRPADPRLRRGRVPAVRAGPRHPVAAAGRGQAVPPAAVGGAGADDRRVRAGRGAGAADDQAQRRHPGRGHARAAGRLRAAGGDVRGHRTGQRGPPVRAVGGRHAGDVGPAAQGLRPPARAVAAVLRQAPHRVAHHPASPTTPTGCGTSSSSARSTCSATA